MNLEKSLSKSKTTPFGLKGHWGGWFFPVIPTIIDGAASLYTQIDCHFFTVPHFQAKPSLKHSCGYWPEINWDLIWGYHGDMIGPWWHHRDTMMTMGTVESLRGVSTIDKFFFPHFLDELLGELPCAFQYRYPKGLWTVGSNKKLSLCTIKCSMRCASQDLSDNTWMYTNIALHYILVNCVAFGFFALRHIHFTT